MFYVIWKSFLANVRNFLTFFCSIIMSVNVLFLLMYIREAARHIKGVETKALAFAYSSELAKQLRMVIPAVIFVTIIVTAYSVRFYIQSRMKDYGMLKILGIRKRDMQKVIILEYAVSCVFSCLIGLLAGRLGTWGLKELLKKSTGEQFAASINMNRVYLLTLVLCVVMILGAVFSIFVMLDSKGTDSLIKKSVVKEKRSTKPRSLLWLLAGIVLIFLSVMMVRNNPMSANIAMTLLCFGIFLNICFGLGYVLERFRQSDRYLVKILEWNHFYHYFCRNKYKIIVQSILGIVIIYFSFLLLRSTLDSRMMPNDFACIEQETGTFGETFHDRFGGEKVSFPFIWVNENSGDSWIGMSVSDYNGIYNKKEKLNNDEVIRIWRIEGTTEDMADSSQNREMESINLGKCLNSETTETSYPYHFRVKEEIVTEIIGFSMSGVIVLPDQIFNQAVEDENFHQRFLILNVKPAQTDEATKYVEEQKEAGILEEAFCKTTIQDIDSKEAMLNRLIVGIVAFVILFFGIFVMWLMQLSELESNKKKYEFIHVMGVRKRRAKAILKKEVTRTTLISVGITVGCAAVFCGTFIASYYSGMSTAFDKAGAEKLLIWILAVYTVTELLFMIISNIWTSRQVIREGK